MPESTRDIHERSAELRQHVESVRALADTVGTAPSSDIRASLDRLDNFVSTKLLPHVSSLKETLGDREGTPLATELTHLGTLADEVSWLRKKVGGRDMTVGTANAARRVLYGFHALLKLHFDKEDEIYLPRLADVAEPPAEQEAG